MKSRLGFRPTSRPAAQPPGIPSHPPAASTHAQALGRGRGPGQTEIWRSGQPAWQLGVSSCSAAWHPFTSARGQHARTGLGTRARAGPDRNLAFRAWCPRPPQDPAWLTTACLELWQADSMTHSIACCLKAGSARPQSLTDEGVPDALRMQQPGHCPRGRCRRRRSPDLAGSSQGAARVLSQKQVTGQASSCAHREHAAPHTQQLNCCQTRRCCGRRPLQTQLGLLGRALDALDRQQPSRCLKPLNKAIQLTGHMPAAPQMQRPSRCRTRRSRCPPPRTGCARWGAGAPSAPARHVQGQWLGWGFTGDQRCTTLLSRGPVGLHSLAGRGAHGPWAPAGGKRLSNAGRAPLHRARQLRPSRPHQAQSRSSRQRCICTAQLHSPPVAHWDVPPWMGGAAMRPLHRHCTPLDP